MLSSCSAELVPLVPACVDRIPCWIDLEGRTRFDSFPLEYDRGACTAGLVRCIEGPDGREPLCVGAVLPDDLEETCNGIDDDCNGYVDDGLVRFPPNDCPSLGRCEHAYERCTPDGFGHFSMTCTYVQEPVAETCNGLDDDCDGVVDNGLETPTYYYEGPIETLGIGECRPGIRTCVDGILRDSPAVLPFQEECGNGLDDDCDTLVDEPDGPLEPRAFALVIDVSGSMNARLGPLRTGVCSWASDFSLAPTTFAIVLVGATGPSPHVSLWQDFSDAATTCATLSSELYGFGAQEYVLEGITLAAELEWPEDGERHVIAFGDEDQHYLEGGADEASVEEACASVPFSLDAFYTTLFASQWVDLVAACGGYLWDIDSSATEFADALRSRFAGGC